MSLLTIIQSAAVKIGFEQPQTVIGNTEQFVVELLAYVNEEGRELVKRGNWQILTKEKTHTTLAQESQTGMYPTDYDHMIDETLWNRSRRRRLYGPVSSQEWQALKATASSPFDDTVVLRGGAFLLNPAPAAGETIAFEYVSKNFCQSSGGTGQTAFAADTDTGVLPEELLELGTIVRFKAQKGLDFTVDLAKYETQVNMALNTDKPKVTVDLSESRNYYGRSPGVVIPEGSWT